MPRASRSVVTSTRDDPEMNREGQSMKDKAAALKDKAAAKAQELKDKAADKVSGADDVKANMTKLELFFFDVFAPAVDQFKIPIIIVVRKNSRKPVTRFFLVYTSSSSNLTEHTIAFIEVKQILLAFVIVRGTDNGYAFEFARAIRIRRWRRNLSVKFRKVSYE